MKQTIPLFDHLRVFADLFSDFERAFSAAADRIEYRTDNRSMGMPPKMLLDEDRRIVSRLRSVAEFCKGVSRRAHELANSALSGRLDDYSALRSMVEVACTHSGAAIFRWLAYIGRIVREGRPPDGQS